MTRFSGALVGTILGLSLPAFALAQDPAQQVPQAPLPPIVRDVHFNGTHDISSESLQRAARVRVGEPLPVSVDRIDDLADRVRRHYSDEGYSFARVHAAFDPSSATLSFDVDEGVIDGVEFTGVGDRLKRTFSEDFALRAGDTFNRARARQALDVLLQPTRGAVRPAHGSLVAGDVQDSDDIHQRRGPFDLVDRGGQRILVVSLYEPAGRFRMLPDLGDREDWFSSVDGFVPSLGFGAAVFDHEEFNHSYVAGHFSYKFASERVGYALGFERPFFRQQKLYVGGELFDLTASDDQWQLSSLEASLAAIGPRQSYRDYYRRRGVQAGAHYRPHPQLELLGLWRSEREEPLPVTSDFSLWNSDDAFRPNRPAVDGHLNALVVGATLDGPGFERESLDSTYRRHQLGTFYGQTLDYPRARNDPSAIWRVDWTTEISTPGLDSDFDFTRSIVSARYRRPLSAHQDFGVRAMGGWSTGTLPTQRLFSVGGVGSVHGYDFKEQTGTSLALLNLEYALGWRNGFKVLGFFDTGRASPNPDWLKGVGFGVGLGDFRVDFGYRTDAIPSSLQVVLRLSKTF
ncbi:MAG TPA: POTRA domain-containing protein [Vicinamibacterales bacterium]|jgi:hypothetical protein